MQESRRRFVKISGAISLIPVLGIQALSENKALAQGRARSKRAGLGSPQKKGAFEPLPPSNVDDISLAKGFQWYPLLKMGDVINAAGDKAGDCCDFIHFHPGENKDHAFLWVNHEYVIDNVLYGKRVKAEDKTKEQVIEERKLVGGSYVEIRRSRANGGRWEVVANSTKAFRIDGNSQIPMVGPAGGAIVTGTMGNCGGGFTPWGSVLSGEENVDVYYQDPAGYGWGNFFPHSKRDYGWIVEVDVQKKSARKLTALGRFAHEGSTVVARVQKKVVVYMGDDAKSQCLYKFVSKNVLTGNAEKDRDLLLEGDLYVANFKKGQWILLSPENEKLKNDQKKRFVTQADICNETREAAHLAGGTKLNRPEDVKVDPQSGEVYFTLTNNSDVGDFHGSIVYLQENAGDHTAASFTFETYLAGGKSSGISCPDNLTFGPGRHLWVCTDISSEVMGKGSHASFVRNSCFRLENDEHGNVYARHFLQGPADAEITGPCFSPDEKSLFLSIQHPGESSYYEGTTLTSHWPLGGSAKPLSTVIVVEENKGSFSR
jgi:secreted PhoX family phosphatase